MMRTLIGIIVFTTGVSAFADNAGTETMWSCSVGGVPRNDVLLVSNGSRSYVMLSGQRVPATLTESDGVKRWAWGNDAIALDARQIAEYYEAGDDKNPKGTFRCRKLK